MTMGERIKTRQQLLDEQAYAARIRAIGDQRPHDSKHANPSTAALMEHTARSERNPRGSGRESQCAPGPLRPEQKPRAPTVEHREGIRCQARELSHVTACSDVARTPTQAPSNTPNPRP